MVGNLLPRAWREKILLACVVALTVGQTVLAIFPARAFFNRPLPTSS